jgi:hypothetical protein
LLSQVNNPLMHSSVRNDTARRCVEAPNNSDRFGSTSPGPSKKPRNWRGFSCEG